MYRITGLISMGNSPLGNHGFSITLPPAHKKAVAACDLNQEKINNAIKFLGKKALLSCGYSEARCEYALGDIRIQWGEWGIEHIGVPGNACGLDIDYNPIGLCPHEQGGVTLHPHNVDTPIQKLLLLTLFCSISDYIY